MIDPTIRNLFLPNDLTPAETPQAYIMAGIPAAGKSTYVDCMQKQGIFPVRAFILDPDRVMQAMPGYQKIYKKDPEQAFKEFEMSARVMAYQMFQEAAELKLPIIKDMGCTRLENVTKVGVLKDLGYKIHVHMLKIDIDTAWERIQNRTRFTPKEMLIERHKGLQETLPLLQSMADSYTELQGSF